MKHTPWLGNSTLPDCWPILRNFALVATKNSSLPGLGFSALASQDLPAALLQAFEDLRRQAIPTQAQASRRPAQAQRGWAGNG